MPPANREYFTVDLRGLRSALRTRATEDGVTESDVLRSALATALGPNGAVHPGFASDSGSGRRVPYVKSAVRLVQRAATRLDHDARTAGLSRGAYLARLIQAAPPVMSSADRLAARTALNNSSQELAIMSRDINHLTQLLRHGSLEAAKAYRARHETLDRDVRAHLALAAVVLADLSACAGPDKARRTA